MKRISIRTVALFFLFASAILMIIVLTILYPAARNLVLSADEPSSIKFQIGADANYIVKCYIPNKFLVEGNSLNCKIIFESSNEEPLKIDDITMRVYYNSENEPILIETPNSYSTYTELNFSVKMQYSGNYIFYIREIILTKNNITNSPNTYGGTQSRGQELFHVYVLSKNEKSIYDVNGFLLILTIFSLTFSIPAGFEAYHNLIKSTTQKDKLRKSQKKKVRRKRKN